jgi:hypothetical protein
VPDYVSLGAFNIRRGYDPSLLSLHCRSLVREMGRMASGFLFFCFWDYLSLGLEHGPARHGY